MGDCMFRISPSSLATIWFHSLPLLVILHVLFLLIACDILGFKTLSCPFVHVHLFFTGSVVFQQSHHFFPPTDHFFVRLLSSAVPTL